MFVEALLTVCLTPTPAQEPEGPAVAFRVDLVETLDEGPVRNATILVRDGVIEKLGQAVIIPESAEVYDLRGTGASAMPPWVLSHANFLQRDRRNDGLNARYTAAESLHLEEDDLSDLLAQGILVLGVDPPGGGIPGRTSVLSTEGEPPRPVALVYDLHLKMELPGRQRARHKGRIRKALDDADKAIEAEAKALEEWEKARKEWEEKQKAAEAEKAKEKEGGKDEEQGEQEERGGEQGSGRGAQRRGPRGQDGNGGGGKPQPEEGPPKEFEPPEIDPDLEPVVEWVRKQRLVQVWLDDAASWLHWKDVLGDRELPYEVILATSSRTESFEEVVTDLAKTTRRVYLPASITYLPDTRIRANLPAELAAAGATLVLQPAADDSLRPARGRRYEFRIEAWRQGLADVVREGLDRTTALTAVSLEPAAAMGQEERVAPLKVGGPATFVVLSGDPLDPTAQALFVVRDGEVVYDRAEEEEKESR